MEQLHTTTHVIERHRAFVEVHVQADSFDLGNLQRRLHTSVPGKEAPAVPPHAPGEVVPGDAAGAVLALPIDALVCDPHVRALPAQLYLNVVPPRVNALRGQRLPPVLKAIVVVRVAVLPGAGVGELSVVLRHSQEVVGGVGVKGQTDCVCNTRDM